MWGEIMGKEGSKKDFGEDYERCWMPLLVNIFIP